MEMCLSGRIMGAEEAERCGLVSSLCPAAELVDEAVRTAARIAALSRPATMSIKERVTQAHETALGSLLLFERRALHARFGLLDRREGMTAFHGCRSDFIVGALRTCCSAFLRYRGPIHGDHCGRPR